MSEAIYHHIGRDGAAKRVDSAVEAVTAAEVDGFAWLHYREATRDDLAELIGLLGLH